MTDTFGVNPICPNNLLQTNPPVMDFGLQQTKREQQTSNNQASAPVANDGNNDGNENGNSKQ